MAIAGALLIGITLGLLGSGGSILTVPVLVYLLGHIPKVAVAESMAIVGAIAVVAAIPFQRAALIDWSKVIYFGIPAMLGTVAGSWFAQFLPDSWKLIIFSIVMLIASVMVWRDATNTSEPPSGAGEVPTVPLSSSQGEGVLTPHPYWQVAIEGVGVGILTGIVGVGGGFLIVPALVLLGGLSLRVAVGTSLVIIALKSLVGLAEHWHNLQRSSIDLDWATVGLFIVVGVVGSLLGGAFNQWVNQKLLKQFFSVFLVVMSLFVLWQEAPKLMKGPREQSTANESPVLSASDSPNRESIPIELKGTKTCC